MAHSRFNTSSKETVAHLTREITAQTAIRDKAREEGDEGHARQAAAMILMYQRALRDVTVREQMNDAPR